MNRWLTITDPIARELLNRSGDLHARLLLIDLAELIYVCPGHPTCSAVASLIHAFEYLKNRVGYEMEPHPKGMIRMPTEDGSR
jgi:hypothetical protein